MQESLNNWEYAYIWVGSEICLRSFGREIFFYCSMLDATRISNKTAYKLARLGY